MLSLASCLRSMFINVSLFRQAGHVFFFSPCSPCSPWFPFFRFFFASFAPLWWKQNRRAHRPAPTVPSPATRRVDSRLRGNDRRAGTQTRPYSLSMGGSLQQMEKGRCGCPHRPPPSSLYIDFSGITFSSLFRFPWCNPPRSRYRRWEYCSTK